MAIFTNQARLENSFATASLKSKSDWSAGPSIPAHHNNLDLIRLLAASQVAVVHLCLHLRIDGGLALKFLQLFPGVPIFFFVSGFLVSQSFERSSNLKSYAVKRVLRIYPALWACLAVSVILVAQFQALPWTSGSFAAWIIAQLTFGQFYNPSFLRDFGLGVLNGSLWTIPVELQFYMALPIIYGLARRFGVKAFWLTAFAGLAVHALFISLVYGSDSLPAKLLQVTVLPWLGLFMVGVVAQIHWRLIGSWFRGRAAFWLTAYGLSAAALSHLGWSVGGNAINSLSGLVLFATVLSAAHTRPSLAERLLRGNDVSYGLYLYHGPVLNAFLELRAIGRLWLGSIATVPLVFTIAVVCAIASWMFVERPILTLKRNKAAQLAGLGDEAHASAAAPRMGQ